MRGFQVAVTFFALLAMVQQSLQLSFESSLRQAVEADNNVNIRVWNNLGIVLDSESVETAFNESNAFIASSDKPYVDQAGRRFHVGKIGHMDVVYVKTGDSSIINTALTVQALASAFPDLEGIIQVGTAGAVNGSLSIGDVIVPSEIAYIGNWKWENFLTRERKGPLQFGRYNEPEPGLNRLQSIAFRPLELYYAADTKPQTVAWLQPNEAFLYFASDLKVKQNVVFGLRATSADIYVVNEAFRLFVHNFFKSSTVDTNSAAAAFTAATNGVPFISFRGVSNFAGGPVTESVTANLAAQNVVNVAIEFIKSVPHPFDN